MIGAIIGDIVGSIYEFDNHRSKEFKFYQKDSVFTDDTVMTIAIAEFHLNSIDKGTTNEKRVLQSLSKWYNLYPDKDYGSGFRRWVSGITKENIHDYPYQKSYGNGAAMRISPIGDISHNVDVALEYAELVTKCSHGHAEGIKGAQTTSLAIFLAKIGCNKKNIKSQIEFQFNYDLGFNIDYLRETYEFNETSQNTVPQAIFCFLESEDFEDAIRTAISIGGDSDTLAAITGGIAEAYYKDIPEWILRGALKRLPKDMKDIISTWYNKAEIRTAYPRITEKINKLLQS